MLGNLVVLFFVVFGLILVLAAASLATIDDKGGASVLAIVGCLSLFFGLGVYVI